MPPVSMIPAGPPGGYYPPPPGQPATGFAPSNALLARTQPPIPAPAQTQAQPPKPVVRARVDVTSPAERKTAPIETTSLAMPSPEELGLTAPKQPLNDEVDWPQIHEHLKQQGAVCSQRLQVQDGYRFIVLLSTTEKDRVHRIEADGPTESTAVRAAMAKVAEIRK
jgi:hypothetical protein